MKTTSIILAALAAATTFAAAQGSLTPPPGAPAPVMKTLDQVEARTPLVAGAAGVSVDGNGTITISQRGSYYLTANVNISATNAHGIVISGDQVTLDLNGFSLRCPTGTGGTAISLGSNRIGTRILNGTIIGGTTVSGSIFTLAGWTHGISGNGTDEDSHVSGISVRGMRQDGIALGDVGSVVERSRVNICGGIGIAASNVMDSQVCKAFSNAIQIVFGVNAGTVSNCYAESVGGIGHGISADDGTVTNSRGISNVGDGVRAHTAVNCRGESTGDIGLFARTATNCTGISQSGTGLIAPVANNCYGQSASGAYGLFADGTATNCRGARFGGTAISAPIAIGCTSAGGTISSPQKHLGTP